MARQVVNPLEFVKAHVNFILIVWGASIGMHHTINVIESQNIKRAEREVRGTVFEDYMKYYSIHPSEPVVSFGGDARYKSDSEIFRTGFKISWDEYIECDKNPFDDLVWYEHYANAKISTRVVTETRGRPDLTKIKGFPVRFNADNESETSEMQEGEIIKYPNYPADCRLKSHMTQHHAYGITKHFNMVSEIVEVRLKW